MVPIEGVPRLTVRLTINTDPSAVYQDFEVPLKLNKAKISWASSDTNFVQIGTDVEQSISTTEYITIAVYRPLNEDAKTRKVVFITVNRFSRLPLSCN